MDKKAKVVLSDLHLGAGYAREGNALEDFVSDETFEAFLAELAAESEQENLEIELILAGDTFDFLQVPSLDASQPFDPLARYPAELYASSSEQDSRHKIEWIMSGHPAFFRALGAFVRSSPPQRSATFIKGNHDVNLHWRAVQDAIRASLGATDEKADCLTFEERRITREGIYVEHGHQYAERCSRFPDFEEPHDPDASDQLYLPSGSRFVFNFFNDIEREHYWVDGVKPITALIWYAFALDFSLAVRALWAFLREAPSLAWGSLPLGGAAKAELAARNRLLQELEDSEHLESVKEDSGERIAFYERVAAAMSLYGLGLRGGEVSQSGWREQVALARGRAEERAVHSALARIAEQRRQQEKANVIVFGHTHEARQESLRYGSVYLNAGTWTWTRDFSGEDLAAWKRLWKHPERYTTSRRLTYVRIDYAEDGTPVGRLEEFGQQEQAIPLWRRLVDWLRPKSHRR